jgi:uncharacterized protein
MSRDSLDYGQMMDAAMRGVVRTALMRVAEMGLPGNHHLYVTFRTNFPGVALPDYLRARYPEEMTIVLQHQFWGLQADEHKFSVSLSFNRVHERLVVPFAALTAFGDPSVQFGLQFGGGQAPPAVQGVKSGPSAPAEKAAQGPADAADAAEPKVVTLDAFRKK